MPKHSFDLGMSKAKAADGFGYKGPTVKPGVHRVQIKKMWLQEENSNGNPMINVLAEIIDSQYAGFGLFDRANLTEQAKPYLKARLDAWGISGAAFDGKGVITDPNAQEHAKLGAPISRIGGVEVAKLGECSVLLKNGTGAYADRLEVSEWFSDDEAPADSDSDDTDDEDEKPAARKSAPADEDDDPDSF